MCRFSNLLVWKFLLILTPFAWAELPQPRLDLLNPIGAGAGTSVEVDVAGPELDDAKSLWFDHPGLRSELVKPNRFKIHVAGDVPEGTYDVRVIGRFGVSNPRLFAVSRGLEDVAEKEPNDASDKPQRAKLNAAVNGTGDQNNQDCFVFAAKQGQRVVVACQACKLDSTMFATLVVADSTGRLLGSNGHYFGRDPLVEFVAPADGDYVVTLTDLSYRGGSPYRLLITDRPMVDSIFPRAVQAGKPVELTALGRNFGPVGKPSALPARPPLEEFKFSFTPTADSLAAGTYRFLEHPTDHTVAPTACTCTLTGLQVPIPISAGALRPQVLMVTDEPVNTEIEPNDRKEQSQKITLPATINGRFERPRDNDWFEFQTGAEPDQQYWIEVFSERLAGQADPQVAVYDEKDNVAIRIDDFGHRINAFDGHLRDPVGAVSLTPKTKYRLLVKETYDQGGPRQQYVLRIRRQVPDYYVAAIHAANPGPGGHNLWSGGATYLDFIIHRQEGFNGPITVTAEGLPAGLHAAPTVVDAETRGTFVLWSDPGMAEWTGPIRLTATGTRGQTPLRREVRPYTRVWADQQSSSRPMRDLIVGVRDKAPYLVRIVPDRLTVEAGKKAEVKLAITRYWPEFKEKLRAIPLGFPGNFRMGEFDIPPDRAEFPITIEVDANTRPGQQTLVIQCQGQVPYNKDPKAKDRPNTLVTEPSLPLTITVTAPPKK